MMKLRKAHLSALAVFSLCLSLPGMPHAQDQKITMSSFNESFEDAVPVSGGVRAGLVFGSRSNPVDLNNLRVRVPDIDSSILCLTATTRDGKYEAEIVYELSRLKEGVYKLPYPTEYNSILEGALPQDLTLLAHLSASECSNNDGYVTIGWRAKKEPVLVLVNSGRTSTEISTALKSGDKILTPCSRIRESRSHTFDTVCELPSSEDNIDAIFILRKRGSNRYVPVKIPLAGR